MRKTNVDTCLEEGKKCLEEKRYDLAIEKFTEAIELGKGEYWEDFYYRGKAYAERSGLKNTSDMEKAYADYKKVLEMDDVMRRQYLNDIKLFMSIYDCINKNNIQNM